MGSKTKEQLLDEIDSLKAEISRLKGYNKGSEET